MPNDDSHDNAPSPVRFPEESGMKDNQASLEPTSENIPVRVESVMPSDKAGMSQTASQPAASFAETVPTNEVVGQSQNIIAQAPAAAAPIKSVNTPGVLILQWLTYAFWGWALVALYWLTSLAVQYFVQTPSDESYSYTRDYLGDLLAYSLAAVIVLFLISIICDVIYSKFEPEHKTGAAMVIMVIHAVIFALCGIGSLIVAVFAVVNLMISSSSNDGAMTTLITAGTMTLLYAATLLRTLRPQKIKRVVQIFWTVMLISTLIIAGLGIFGPAAYAQRTKNDRAVEEGLPEIARAINDYADENGKLPSSLNDATLRQSYYFSGNDQVALIMDKGLVSYSPKEEIEQETIDSEGVSIQGVRLSEDKVYHYQLCAVYDVEKDGYSYNSYRDSDQEYDTSPDTASHAAGKVCYDLQTDYIY